MVTPEAVVLPREVLLLNVPYLLPSAAAFGESADACTSVGGSSREASVGTSWRPSSLTAVYVMRGVMRAKKSGTRMRTRKSGNTK